MKYVDVTDLFDTSPGELALLSTYQFDPDFFERRLLRSRSLSEARRIAVFMDAARWAELLRQDAPARLLNRRYLVVPVRRAGGVFHPKLGLLLTEAGGRILCGSNNLTRCGCSSNLELLNSLDIDPESQVRAGGPELARDAFTFFRRATDDALGEPGRIVRGWLEEYAEYSDWLREPADAPEGPTVRLIHTYTGSLWDRIALAMDRCDPERLLIISPFFDPSGELFRRIHRRYPSCRIEVVAQQGTTNPPTEVMRGMRGFLGLSDLRSTKRRLHAKLIAWEGRGGTGCLTGSANFTTAAMDGHNVETCLLIEDTGQAVEALFDGQLSKKPINPEDFEVGGDEEPQAVAPDTEDFRIVSASLNEHGALTIQYACRIEERPIRLSVAIRCPGERRDPFARGVPAVEEGSASFAVSSDVISDSHGSLLATLYAETAAGIRSSDPIWVIQEHRLTLEREGRRSASAQRRIEETGEGLPEFLEALGEREGIQSVIEFLQNTSIRYFDGEGRLGGFRRFRLRMTDPFQPDLAPTWLLHHEGSTADLESAIYDFVDRHERQRLRKHATTGNVNGLLNFLDILTALIRLLYVYYKRGVVKRNQLNGRLIQYIHLAAGDPDDESAGFLATIAENLGGEVNALIEVGRETNISGHLSAALLIAQKIRLSIPPAPSSLTECLPHVSQALQETLDYTGLGPVSDDEIFQALQSYDMFEEIELLGYQILLSSKNCPDMRRRRESAR